MNKLPEGQQILGQAEILLVRKLYMGLGEGVERMRDDRVGLIRQARKWIPAAITQKKRAMMFEQRAKR
ncbi:hypothetical protein, partial [Salmonella enterica]|uniref:hypothetical protein n=1 Tax=Salmonella enterica TaxID=28901 RepID=UPI003075E192